MWLWTVYTIDEHHEELLRQAGQQRLLKAVQRTRRRPQLIASLIWLLSRIG